MSSDETIEAAKQEILRLMQELHEIGNRLLDLGDSFHDMAQRLEAQKQKKLF